MPLSFAFIISLAGPFFLLPLETVSDISWILEELLKIFVVYIIYTQKEKTINQKVLLVLLAGALFALSESMLYLTNLFNIGNLSLFPFRIVLTGILHMFTALLYLLAFEKNRLLIIVALLIGIAAHFAYNYFAF